MKGGRGELIMLITVCGCDVLKCKAHLNPAANYRMFLGGVSTAEVGLGLSRGLKHKNWHQLNAKSVITGGRGGGREREREKKGGFIPPRTK